MIRKEKSETEMQTFHTRLSYTVIYFHLKLFSVMLSLISQI